ncbi:hypothetical protein ACFOTA_09430 [Chitinophaga sp. GCM10012297]|uniref:Uncharacterized protein n=1 Tax=Chitinophaga chungangae TaxID=2821488 RepID=A0ABS3YE77_9BACT|nr:hypothetical protein [Chitinophaga chungangae]MBO9152424.1 hypothetical protein [Chitinophaga chungangae]
MQQSFLRILPVAVAMALAACGGNTTASKAALADSLEIDSLSAVVMGIHDEGMAQTMAIRRLKTRVEEVKDSLAAKKADTAAYATAGRLLDSANAAMDAWMHGYDMELKDKTAAEKKAYLEAEKKKISDVHDLMASSIKGAKTLLKEE